MQEISNPTPGQSSPSTTVSASDEFFSRMSEDDRTDIEASLVLSENVEIGKTCTRKEGQNIPDWLIRELKECIRFRDSINENILKMIGIAVDAKSVYILYHEMENRTMKEYYIKESL
ncbi:hypothetical protein MAR_015459, partial [Mya arenaria]